MSEKLPFFRRFDITLDQKEVIEKFINRVYSALFAELRYPRLTWHLTKIRKIGEKVGIMVKGIEDIYHLIGQDFIKCIGAIEALYEDAVEQETGDIRSIRFIDRKLDSIFHESEGDLGIKWRDGQFWRTGAKLLDEGVVNENLKWLLDKGYKNIYKPFEKALAHYGESIEYPEKLHDVVTDMYEAIEATAKGVCENDRELSANAEKFISILNLSEQHKEMLKAYIKYANRLARHAQRPTEKRRAVSNAEAENFIYLTGIFIRFAIQKLEEQG